MAFVGVTSEHPRKFSPRNHIFHQFAKVFSWKFSATQYVILCDPYVLYLIPCGPHVLPCDLHIQPCGLQWPACEWPSNTSSSCNPFPPIPAPPILLNASISLTLVAGSPALLPCSVRLPDPALSFQWFYNAQLLDTATTEGIQLLSNGSLTIANVRTSLGGTYICVASNSLGTVRSTVAVNVESKWWEWVWFELIGYMYLYRSKPYAQARAHKNGRLE